MALDLDERARLIADLGDKNVMILRNHGTLTVGDTCADAFMRMFFLERACAIQTRALAGGATANRVNQGVAEKTAALGQMGFNAYVGAVSWPGLLRKLDRIDPAYKN